MIFKQTKLTLHLKKALLLTGAIAIANTGVAYAETVNITNPSFESSFDGWSDTDPSAISGEGYSGSKSVKITGSAGAAVQTVSVTANTNYTLSAFVKGKGKVGAIVNGTSFSNTGSSSAWEEVTVSFNSGSATNIDIFANYGGGEGRFDAFTLSTTETTDGGTGGETGGTTPESCTASNLYIATATDNGTNDGHGPLNTIDDNLSDESRWSSNGSGKTITYDLGAEASVKSLQVKWFKGNTRSSYFEVDTSVNNVDWSSVLASSQSSGASSDLENIDLIDSEARYVRITGFGNSSNTWNSIIETKILGCAETDPEIEPQPEPEPEPEPETPSGDFDWAGWKVTLPVNGDTWYNDGNTSSAAEIQPAGCSNDLFNDKLDIDYFWSDSEGLHFKVPMNLDGKTPNTSYIRSELRELHDWTPCETTSEANWSYGGDHTLSATIRIDDYDPSNPKVVVGQIHGHDISYATIKLHWEGDNKPIRVIYNQTPSSSTPNNVYLGYVDSTQFWDYTIKMTNTGIELSAGGVTKTITFGNELSNDWKNADFYFKAGLYPQQKPSASSTEAYEATFSKVVVSH